ncbi:hypothetical protein J437_LFUL009625 [Ladona fulva]|uniref:Uncharacterized protein n=1 Tax=Ladona fulva TaxID=123851 RepID=A0A8K0P0T2_LADFU|nr:hypothetical protein J437_LFUL009625 [Ladona fulva]
MRLENHAARTRSALKIRHAKRSVRATQAISKRATNALKYFKSEKAAPPKTIVESSLLARLGNANVPKDMFPIFTWILHREERLLVPGRNGLHVQRMCLQGHLR